MSHGYDYEQDPQAGPEGGAGRGRRRRREPQQDEYQQGIPEQYRPDDFSEPGYPRPDQPQDEYADEGYPQPEYGRPDSPHRAPYDAQWEHSGLGWDPQAWREASAADPHWDERTWVEPQRAEWAGFEATRTEADTDFESFEHEQYGPGSRHRPGERGTESFAPEPFRPESFEPGSFDPGSFDPDSFDGGSYGPGSGSYGTGSTGSYGSDSFERGHDAAAPGEPLSTRSTGLAAELSAGRGVFGAAGLAVVAGISAVVGKPFLAIVIGLSQIGLAIGWLRTVGSPNRYSTAVLVALTGLAASAIAYRLDTEHAPGAIATAVGVGFVLLAADQLLHRDRDSAPGAHRLEALAAAVTGAALAALPAGFLVAQRQDSKLAAACGLAAAVAVLCSALVGGAARAIGVAAAAAAGAAVGGITAISLSSGAGVGGGAIGGVAVGLLAAAAARVTDRLGAEGGDVRISSQTLPLAFAGVGAAIAVSVLR